MEQISWPDFEKVELRAGTVVEVKEFPEARKPAFIWQYLKGRSRMGPCWGKRGSIAVTEPLEEI